jgi:hypothetical protein
MATAQLTNITPPRVPLLDPKTGLVSREWYRFFLSLFVLTGSGQNTASLTDLQVGPPMPTQEDFGKIVISIDSLKTQPSQESALDQIAELQKQIQAMEAQIECPCTELTAELQKQVDGLQLTPPLAFGTIAFQNTGISGSAALAKITALGTDGSLTFTNGIITAYVAPT